MSSCVATRVPGTARWMTTRPGCLPLHPRCRCRSRAWNLRPETPELTTPLGGLRPNGCLTTTQQDENNHEYNQLQNGEGTAQHLAPFACMSCSSTSAPPLETRLARLDGWRANTRSTFAASTATRHSGSSRKTGGSWPGDRDATVSETAGGASQYVCSTWRIRSTSGNAASSMTWDTAPAHNGSIQ